MAYEKIGPVPLPDSNAPGTNLIPDPELMELAIVAKIRDIWVAIPNLAQYVKIEMRDRFPESDTIDEQLTTVADPIVIDTRRTSIIQIGIPAVTEFERTNDLHTQLNFEYPITFDLEVVDSWDESNGPLYYKNSRHLAMAIYMNCRLAIKRNRTLGFNNCETDYLQQTNPQTIDFDTGGKIHAADWSLIVKCSSILV